MTADSGITIRELASLEEYHECCELQEETWGRGFSERVPAAILRVGQKVGGVTAGAFDRNGRMLGFVFGLTGVRNGRLAHWSDMLAVREEARGSHLGERLKHYQRDAVLKIGVEIMYWTFDPLVARNAHLNINRLGAPPVEYIPNMYGAATGSTLHGNLPTDRLVAGWELARNHEPLSGTPTAALLTLPLANPLATDQAPDVLSLPDAAAVRVQIPRDGAHSLPAATAMRWRMSVRNAMTHYLAHDYAVTHFARSTDDHLPFYVLTHATS